MDIRTRTPLAVLPAFIFLLLYIFKNNNVLKSAAVIFALIVISVNTSGNIKLQNTAKLSFEQDKITASRIPDIVYTKYPEIYTGKYRIAFYGSIYPNNHHLKKSSDTFNGSFFSWDNGNPHRIYSFLKIMGMSDNIGLSDYIGYNKNLTNAPEDLRELIKKMPSYPYPDCAQLYKDTVIVKLSD